MDKFRAIAYTSLQDALRRKLNYVVGILLLLILLIFASEQTALGMASRSGETNMKAQILFGLMSATLSLWRSAAFVMAILLGSTSVASEVTSKTIVNILARPVDRATYLFARWCGIALYLTAFSLFGLLVAQTLSWISGIPWPLQVWLGEINYLITPILWSAIATGFSAFLGPVLAGVLPLLLLLLPMIARGAMHHPNPLLRWLSIAVSYLPPADMPVDIGSKSFSTFTINGAVGLYVEVYIEHLLYAASALAVGGAIFSRREITLR